MVIASRTVWLAGTIDYAVKSVVDIAGDSAGSLCDLQADKNNMFYKQ